MHWKNKVILRFRACNENKLFQLMQSYISCFFCYFNPHFSRCRLWSYKNKSSVTHLVFISIGIRIACANHVAKTCNLRTDNSLLAIGNFCPNWSHSGLENLQTCGQTELVDLTNVWPSLVLKLSSITLNVIHSAPFGNFICFYKTF